jgi:hypothetical protein
MNDRSIRLSSLYFSRDCFVGRGATKQFSARRNHFSLLPQNSGNVRWLSRGSKNGGKPVATTGDSRMQTLTIILAFAFVVAGASMAGSANTSLPGVGAFAYTGSPIVTSAPQAVVVAAAR